MNNPIAHVDSDLTPLLVNARTAAAILCISERTLWTLTDQRDVPCVRIGRAVRYDRRDLMAWIDKTKEQTHCAQASPVNSTQHCAETAGCPGSSTPAYPPSPQRRS